MTRHARSSGLAIATALTLAVTIAGPALGSSPRRLTYGDVEAIFQARTTANQVQTFHDRTASAVRQGFARGRISPFFNSHPFCSSGWLILLVSEGAASGHQESVAYRSHLRVSFTVDGQAVTTQATALKRFLAPAPADDFWGWSVAHLYAPGAIAAGEHTVVTTTTVDGSVIDVFTTTFTTGTGAGFCD